MKGIDEVQLRRAERALLARAERDGTVCLSRVKMELSKEFTFGLLRTAIASLSKKGKIRAVGEIRETYELVGI
jgi:hypothetical protein